MKRSLMFGFVVICLLSQIVNAVDVERSYNISGLNVSVELKITNDNEAKDVVVVEDCIPLADCSRNENLKYEDEDGYRKYYLRWKVNLSPGEIKILRYEFSLPGPGKYAIPSTKIYTQEGVFEGNVTEIVAYCNANGVCETPEENFINCPEDCTTGIEDNICDAVKDNKVDPDCEEGADPDDTVHYEEIIGKEHTSSNLSIYIAIFAIFGIIAGIITLLIRKIKKRKRKK